MSFSITGQKNKKPLSVGDNIPAFALYDQDGKNFDVADYIGKQVLVIYFYPKDESIVCTKEACAFRDDFEEFVKSGAKIIGINNGSVASHKAFQTHYTLPFTLLSDPGNKVYNLFGITNKLFMTGRKTFVVDLKGKIVYTHEAMFAGQEHADEALKFIRSSIAKH
ncbi:MAG: peroxiredoxin [Bacteroidetes bacterium]|jgi:peroxiredoxin Q/BCP|nr:peroxiredoxin [Bacteroidota bacterium]